MKRKVQYIDFGSPTHSDRKYYHRNNKSRGYKGYLPCLVVVLTYVLFSCKIIEIKYRGYLESGKDD